MTPQPSLLHASTRRVKRLARSIVRRLFSPVQVHSAKFIRELVAGKRGIEIGGPSKVVFGRKGVLPVYRVIGQLDNVNFGAKTIWEGTIAEGQTFKYDRYRTSGRQTIGEATKLPAVADAAYECLLASHMLEHTANPIAALREWIRVLTDDGVLVLVVPHKEGTFDHRRPVTPLAHMIDDFKRGADEHDLTHLPEILELHDLSMDKAAGTPEQFNERSLENFDNRCLHHHTFTTRSLAMLVDHVGLQTLSLEACKPFHIMLAARKTAKADNTAFLSADAEFTRASPFAADRKA